MKYSALFGKTQHGLGKGSDMVSHQLLIRAGFIRESTAGRYYFLPLGWRVHEKIKQIIKEEMDNAGAQEMITPVLHPLELWQETNRTNTAGFELMRVKDRRGAEFALGGTAEEMFVDVVRKFRLTYKDLPFNIYQFSSKFRDELRARGGLLRVREFVMKDAYSFHATQADFEKEYETMGNTYTTIFKRLGLESLKVEAGNGYIGGEYSHEFQVQCESGEDTVFWAKQSGKAFNQEKAPSQAPQVAYDEEAQEMKEVEGVGIIGVEELATYLQIPVEKTTKTLLFWGDNGRMIAAAVRGGYDINEFKLMEVANTKTLKLADEETVERITNAKVGYAGLLNLPSEVEMYIDESCDNRVNFEMGANRTNYHTININWGRDIQKPERFYDIKVAKKGDLYPETGEAYEVFRAIEVGNIFQLGYHYSSLMKNATYVSKEGKEEKYYMGCYGIGIGRTLATIVEKYHDEKGICWPMQVAPYQAHLVEIGRPDTSNQIPAENIYQLLNQAGVEVLWDDRDLSPGAKFADADLIGIPVRLVASPRNGDKVEWKLRTENESELITVEEAVSRLRV
jgi:prolyl-tRNA synthetase